MSDKEKPTSLLTSDERDVSQDLRLGQDATETIDIKCLFTSDLTTSGSFDISGQIWATTFGKLTQALPIPALLVDLSLNIVTANQACRRIGNEYDAVIGSSVSCVLHDAPTGKRAISVLKQVFSTRNPQVVNAWLGIEGNSLWGRMSMRSIRVASDRFVLILIEDFTAEKERETLNRKHTEQLRKAHDDLERKVEQRTTELKGMNEKLLLEMAERKRYQESLRQSNESFNSIVERSSDGILIAHPAGLVIYANRAAEQFLSRPRNTLVGSQLGIPLEEGDITSVDISQPNRKRGVAWMRVEGTTWNAEPAFLCVLHDITELKHLEANLIVRASHDVVTGLFSRWKFMEMLQSSCRTSERYALDLSVCICDLDNFKAINDTYGHQSGDRILAQFGEMIRTQVRDTDFAGRYGGDEFIIAFPQVGTTGATACMERIRKVLQHTVLHLPSASCRLTLSAGIAQYEPHEMSIELLIK